LKKPQEFFENQNRRKFFENYAKNHGFDALIPENWYSVTARSVLSILVFSFYFLSQLLNLFIYLGRNNCAGIL
jgi:hypothetical protein